MFESTWRLSSESIVIREAVPMNLYQCRKCGETIEIARFITDPLVICGCGGQMVKVAVSLPKQGNQLQLFSLPSN